jgi:2-amino-4-hydroxy-6-hydroxymethyldihydropteridine diphosphokinase
MILIGIGANLAAPGLPDARSSCLRGLELLAGRGVRVAAVSPWYEAAPVPKSDQPWFVNAVARLTTGLDPAALLAELHQVEAALGRVRVTRNEARVLDLDLLDYDGRVSRPGDIPILPHPRLHLRAFVLHPLTDLAPDWRHPVSGLDVPALVAALPGDQPIRRLAGP